MKQLFLALLIILCSACEAFDFEEARGDTARDKLEQEYQESFANNFGTYGVLNIDPSHNWGFDNILFFEYKPQTRVAVPNSNQWSGYPYYLDVPKPLRKEQINVVTTWFKTHRNPSGITVNWTDYFVQQVSSTKYGRHMNELYDNGTKGNNHINNFNSGDGASINVDNKYNDKIMYMQGQSTVSFSYHESVSDKIWYDHFVIIPGEEIDPRNAHGLWGMYFVGFDYEAYKFKGSSDNVPRDWYFNDWIIKITPGLRTNPAPVRIMAEDLGAIGDFDFNDVVIDVYINYNEYWHGADYGIIILRAAGGTMPLYVGDKDHEVHKMFGVDVTTMVNTHGGKEYSVQRPIVQWSFIPTSANPIDISLLVENTKEDIKYEIKAKLGTAPGKFAVPTTVQWSPERINIKNTYPKFPLWVRDQTNKFWE